MQEHESFDTAGTHQAVSTRRSLINGKSYCGATGGFIGISINTFSKLMTDMRRSALSKSCAYILWVRLITHLTYSENFQKS